MSKLASSRYRSGRSKAWLKSKCFTESDLVIIGTDRDRKTGALRALLADTQGHNLTYVGAAFIGLRGDAWDSLGERLKHLAVQREPASFGLLPKRRAAESLAFALDITAPSLTTAGGLVKTRRRVT